MSDPRRIAVSPTSPPGTQTPLIHNPLIVVAHLRWDFVFQRPQHLMTRAAKTRQVFYVEEPIFGDHADQMVCRQEPCGVVVCTPHIGAGDGPLRSQARTAALLEGLIAEHGLQSYDLWMYTPMEWPITVNLRPRVTIYDCMDELANFKGAPPELRERENSLFDHAELVFTGGHRLYEAKRQRHSAVYPFPSSVDAAHFAQARQQPADPADQSALPRPRLGFFGVIDERFDTELIAQLAARRPEWQIVLIGPVVKIDPAELPRAENLHYLGIKSYTELPAYLAHWDVAMLPFARNAATEFISPTKTPEYLAAGVPVVSTGIRDVVRPYGEQDLVRIADGLDAFEAACAQTLAEAGSPSAQARAERADAYISGLSWDHTWHQMHLLIEAAAHQDEADTTGRVAADD